MTGAYVELKEVASVHAGGRMKLSGKHFVTEGVPAYGAGGLNGLVAAAEYDDHEAVILSSIGARCGKCFYASGSWTSLANTQVILPDTDIVNARFLWYQLNDEGRWPRSGSAQPFIKPALVKVHRIWLPAMEEQVRVANLLDAALKLEQDRSRSLALMEDLIAALFIDLFGDPRENPQNWPVLTFPQVMNDVTSKVAKIQKSAFQTTGRFPIVDQSKKSVAGFSDDPTLVRSVSGAGVIAFGDHTRSVKLVDFPFIAGADGVKILTPTESVRVHYLEWLLKLNPVQDLGYSRHMRELKRMKFPVPPLLLQEKFADQLAEFRDKSLVIHQSLDMMKTLFASLRAHEFAEKS